MTQHGISSSLAVFDYQNHKLCDLYDSQNDLAGQAFDITRTVNIKDGVKELSFTIPFMVDETKNFRWKYMKSEYLIRLIYRGKTEWYIAQKPEKHKEKNGIYGNVQCAGTESALRTMNIYKDFDDENGIGTISYLIDQILAGTGWHRGHTDPLLEKDGVTEKIRSITSGNKKGALGLISTVCNLFKCYPVFDSDTKTLELYNYNNRDQVLEGTVGRDMEALTVKYNSSDIVTRLYVEGEYGEDGYVGIDSANPTGLNYILNFDYFREIGMFTQDHEYALETYLEDIGEIKESISENMGHIIVTEDDLNNLIGQCKVAVYYEDHGFTTPVYEYGEMTDEQKKLNVGDKVVVLNSNGTFRYATIETTAASLLTETGDYGIAKFVRGAAGLLGADEVQIEAKEKEIENLQRKISTTVKEDKIAEYEAEIARLREEIANIYTRENGLYAKMHSVMKPDGLLYLLKHYNDLDSTLQLQQDDVESDFVIAMGDMLRDGYWNNSNYIGGQEQHLYDDAVDQMNILSKPTVTYTFNLIRLHKEYGIPLEDFKLNDIFKIYDPDLRVNENLFISSITLGIDNEDAGSIEVSNSDITINANDLGALLSRMSQLADLIDQKNTLYNRAQAISKSGEILADRLNGQIDVLKTQLLSTVSNWHTDEQGNILFESADGTSAMMLCGAGFMIANSKDGNGEWMWRTFGTGEGFTADEIVAGFISADRIEAGSISVNKVEPGFGGSLVITGNPSIQALNDQIAPSFQENQSYTAGQYVNHNGIFYLFINDFPGGTFEQAYSYMTATNVATELRLLPDKIIQYVGRQGFGRTFIQETDPTLDPEVEVHTGDYWIKATINKTWGNVKTMNYQTLKQDMWGLLKSAEAVYYWDGSKWVQLYDFGMLMEAYTRITQTADAIVAEAERAEGAYVRRSETLQTADQIVTKVENYVDGELTAYSNTTQTQSMISATISDRLGNYYNKTETNSQITSTISSKLGNYYNKTETESKISTTISSQLGNYYNKTETNSQITSTISSKLGDYYNKTETNSQISTTISSRLGNYYNKTETESKITSTISSKLGSYYTKTETDSQISSTISSRLNGYSNTTQTQSMISAAVSNKYTVQTNVEITADGVNVKAGKYVKITAANNATAVQIDGDGIDMKTAGKAYIHAKDGSNSAIIFGTDYDTANFSVGLTGDVFANSIATNELTINGRRVPDIIVAKSQPSGHNKLWIFPTSQTQKQWNWSYSSGTERVLNQGTWGLGHYRDYTIPYSSADYLSGNLFYGIVVSLYVWDHTGTVKFRASLKNGSSWITIRQESKYISTNGYINMNYMVGTAGQNVMSTSGGNFTVRLDCDCATSHSRITGEITLKAKNNSSAGAQDCSVFYIQ